MGISSLAIVASYDYMEPEEPSELFRLASRVNPLALARLDLTLNPLALARDGCQDLA